MRFLSKTFSARKDTQVKVTVSQPTAVKLMTAKNLENYRKNITHTYWGGNFDETTIVFDVPGDGQWAIVVEKGTFFNPIDIEASVELTSGLEATPLPGGGALPKAKQEQPEDNFEGTNEDKTDESENENSDNDEEIVTSEENSSENDDDTNKQD